jgi:hypothetical protein
LVGTSLRSLCTEVHGSISAFVLPSADVVLQGSNREGCEHADDDEVGVLLDEGLDLLHDVYSFVGE